MNINRSRREREREREREALLPLPLLPLSLPDSATGEIKESAASSSSFPIASIPGMEAEGGRGRERLELPAEDEKRRVEEKLKGHHLV